MEFTRNGIPPYSIEVLPYAEPIDGSEGDEQYFYDNYKSVWKNIKENLKDARSEWHNQSSRIRCVKVNCTDSNLTIRENSTRVEVKIYRPTTTDEKDSFNVYVGVAVQNILGQRDEDGWRYFYLA